MVYYTVIYHFTYVYSVTIAKSYVHDKPHRPSFLILDDKSGFFSLDWTTCKERNLNEV
jgi:hypothetical protein